MSAKIRPLLLWFRYHWGGSAACAAGLIMFLFGLENSYRLDQFDLGTGALVFGPCIIIGYFAYKFLGYHNRIGTPIRLVIGLGIPLVGFAVGLLFVINPPQSPYLGGQPPSARATDKSIEQQDRPDELTFPVVIPLEDYRFSVGDNQSDAPTLAIRPFTNHQEASIEIHNTAPYPISVRVTGRLIDGDGSPSNLNHPYVIKWQGIESESLVIPSQDVGVLNVVAFDVPPEIRLPILGPIGSARCLNFNTAEKHAKTTNYFTELGTCTRSSIINWDALPNDSKLILNVALHATSQVDLTKSTQWDQDFLIQPGNTTDSIQFTPISIRHMEEVK